MTENPSDIVAPATGGNREGDNQLSDAELVALYRDKEMHAAFAELVNRYKSRLYKVLLGMVGDPPLAEELWQRVFVKAALRMGQLREPQAFYAWLLAIARATTIDELRKSSRRDRAALDSEMTESVGGEAEPDVKEAVHAVLAQLGPEDRMTLILADMQELSMAEVAQALEVKLSAAKMRVMRARARFRKLYQEQT